MRKLEWNALHVGDEVLVHEQHDAGLALVPGTVAMIDTAPGSNDIGIRVEDPRRVLRPARLAVHLAPLDSAESCWRCDAGATGDVHATDVGTTR
jgi:hypothetical protein